MNSNGEKKEISESNPEQQELLWLEGIYLRVERLFIEIASIRDEISEVAGKGSYAGILPNHYSSARQKKSAHEGISIDLMADLTKKVNEIHRLHFAGEYLVKKKNTREKFLAEILVTPARNQK
ncbi:hypothetical protein [Pedobacter sp. Leaf176]|uniref:hypothetical protein n=1 Tax=Pedobacter sp. Leaf176 TaxID=1736286 RepID=UPI0006FAD19E|nr:hypothetical protein [Pedobacter sp. Leaf176]KQR65325.1 hypothetical protein ASF92_20565 [Pedobacter sp. Leaf176]